MLEILGMIDFDAVLTPQSCDIYTTVIIAMNAMSVTVN